MSKKLFVPSLIFLMLIAAGSGFVFSLLNFFKEVFQITSTGDYILMISLFALAFFSLVATIIGLLKKNPESQI